MVAKAIVKILKRLGRGGDEFTKVADDAGEGASGSAIDEIPMREKYPDTNSRPIYASEKQLYEEAKAAQAKSSLSVLSGVAGVVTPTAVFVALVVLSWAYTASKTDLTPLPEIGMDTVEK